MTDGAYCGRLYGLYFLLTGGADDAVDAGAAVETSAGQNRFQAFFDGGGQPLRSEELFLLIHAYTIKGHSVGNTERSIRLAPMHQHFLSRQHALRCPSGATPRTRFHQASRRHRRAGANEGL